MEVGKQRQILKEVKLSSGNNEKTTVMRKGRLGFGASIQNCDRKNEKEKFTFLVTYKRERVITAIIKTVEESV